jgi:hypothetical protein
VSTLAGDSRGENGYQMGNGLSCLLLPNLAHVCPMGSRPVLVVPFVYLGFFPFLSSQFYFYFLK